MNLVRRLLPQELRLVIRALYFVGNRVGCPCCGWSFRRFMNNPRPSRCPRCWSLERHRLIWLYLRDRTDFFSRPAQLLHFAPEYCFLRTFRSLRHLDYVTADLCSPRAKFKMDICDITFEDNSFDVIICSHVLEHVQDDRKAMSELYRVLKPGGWAILQTPFDPKRNETYEDVTVTSPEARERIFGQHDHVRIYGLDYKDRLVEAGFKVVMVPFLQEVNPEVKKRFDLPEEDICLCTKSQAATTVERAGKGL